MRVLVTGATGFAGLPLCRELIAREIQTRAFVRRPSDALTSLGAELVLGDLNDPSAIASAVEGMDAIVHLAARVHVMSDDAKDPLSEFRRINVQGTRILAQAARAAGVKHIVFASSVKAVGDASTDVWNSATVARPTDAYGISKLEAERVLLDMRSDNGPSVTIIRFPLMYGPGMKGNMLRLFRMIDRGWPVPVGTRENARSMLFVGNAVTAIARVLDRAINEPLLPCDAGPLFIADGPPQSTSALVQDVARTLGRRARVIHLPTDALLAIGHRSRALTGGRLTAVLERLLSSLAVDEREFARQYDFHPPYTPHEGIEITSRWFRQSC